MDPSEESTSCKRDTSLNLIAVLSWRLTANDNSLT